MSFDSEIQSESPPLNIVIKIGSTYFSRRQVDSGLVVPSANQIVGKVNLASVNLDLRNIRTSIPSNSFELLDENESISTFILTQPNKYLGTEVEIWTGFTTGSYPWADYVLSSRSIISSINYIGNAYQFIAKEITNLTNTFLYRIQDDLALDIDSVQTTIKLISSAAFPASGYAKIDDEIIQFTGNNFIDTLTGITRGDLFSTAATHKADTDVFSVINVQTNPLTLLLQIMISPGGGGIYDVLIFGMGIDQSLIDIATIEGIRDTYFASDVYRFYIFNQGEALEFIETELILPTNTRLITNNGKISLTYIDQTTPIKTLDEDTIIGRPSWTTSADKVVNRIAVKWGYSIGLDSYSRTSVFENSESISLYGLKSIVYEFHGIQPDLNGQSIIAARMGKLLQRLKDPRQKIVTRSFMSNLNLALGKTVTLIHRYVPGYNTLGINAPMNILEKDIDFNSGITTLGLFYTTISAAGIDRSGVIAPSPFIASVISQTSFTVPNGNFYEFGFVLSIDGELQTVYSVTGNTIVMENPYLVTLTTSKRVKFPTYNLASEGQKNRFAFIGKNNNANFDDGKPTYKIVP